MPWEQIRIQSDGSPRDTVFTLSDGKEIEGISSAFINLEGGSMPSVDLTIWMPKVDVHVYPAEITFECPICLETVEHLCKGNNTT